MTMEIEILEARKALMQKIVNMKEVKSFEKVRRDRIRLALAAYSYEILNISIIDDAAYDVLALEVHKNRDTITGHPLDLFFKEEFNPYTGAWIHSYPEEYLTSLISHL